jgi:hypothetical protein
MKPRAIQEFRKALLLDPTDAEAAGHLKTLRESNPPSTGAHIGPR